MKRTTVPVPFRREALLGLLLALLGAAGGLEGASITVNDATDAIHNAVGQCALTGSGTCSIHDAILYANAHAPGPHTVTFSIAALNLASSLEPINVPLTIDGAFGAPRVDISGGGARSGFDIQPGGGGVTPGSGTTIKNLVIRNMSGAGIAITGGGNSVFNCYIGTNAAGTAAQGNSGAGISVTTVAAGPFTFPPNLSGIGPNLIGIDPTSGNLISGNGQVGIDIFGQRTVLTTVAFNKIGTNFTGLAAIPNGSHGVAISGDSFANTIGPGNIISGNNSSVADGINIQGTVMAPNVVTTNIIGPASGLLINLGNGREGIRIDSSLFDISIPEVVTLGPANIIGYNGEDGVLITGSCKKVRVFGNFIGVAEDPSSAGTFLDLGNVRDGIRASTPGHQIGGASVPETNVISANNSSGITLVSTATDVRIQGNIIGRDPFNLINFPNTLDGITLTNVGNNAIGGTGAGEANVIAGNGRNGVKITSGGNGWANLITRNSIFGNHVLVTGMGIDLDHDPEGVDPTDNLTPGPDPNTAYANYGQNAPVISTGVNAPHYNPVTGSTTVSWTLETSATTPVTLEFFVSDAAGAFAHGEGQKYIGTVSTSTDGTGHATASSVITPSPAYDTRGKFITMTVTPTNTVPDLPGPSTTGPANNTSEFSNAVRVPNPGSLQFSSATYSAGEGAGTATITARRTGGSDGIVTVDYATSDGTAHQPGDYTTAAATLSWADADAADKTFAVPIIDDNIFEGNETVNLALTNATGFAALGAPNTAVLTIVDNDAQPTIAISDVSLPEGNSGTTPFVFNVTLSNPSTQTVTVNFTTADNTATLANNDYVAASGVVTFPPLSTLQTVTVFVNGDTNVEPNETFLVNLSGAVNATIADAQGVGTIQNDDSPAPSATALVSSANPSVFGQSVTFTATVTGTGPIPTGTVTFLDGATTLGTGALNGSGVATFTTSALAVASHPITASYGGDSNFTISTSPVVNQVVNKASTTTALVSNINPSTSGQAVTFTATVTAVAPGTGTPTGTVTFLDGATTLGTGALNGSGVATFTTSALTVASHPITAVYGGDASFNGSTSSIVNQVVNAGGGTPSATALVSSANPSVFGQSVTFTATVTGTGPIPTGTVTFLDGATTLGTGALNGSGVATFTTSALAVASHPITASYGGDVTFAVSTSPVVNQVVNKASTAAALVSNINPSAFGQAVTFTATVTAVAPGTGTPTGTVTFLDGAVTLGTGALNGSGVATFTTSALSVASHPITASYGGDATFAVSTSPVVNQAVNKANTVTALVSNLNPSTSGQAVTFTATVTAVAPGTGTPAGTVTFLDGATILGTGVLNGSGVATFTTSSLTVASHPITAVYGGNGSFNGSTSSIVNQVVNAGGGTPSATALVSSANPSVFGQSVTFTATVTGTGPIPTGTVTFLDGATTLGTAALNGSGVATLTASVLAVGSHSMTGSYGGDSTYAVSTSPAVSQVVNKANTVAIDLSSINPSSVGQSVTFTATVTAVAPGAGTPAGTVTFLDGATTLGTGALNGSGVATFATSALAVGSHSITASYGGDASFNASASSVTTQVVAAAAANADVPALGGIGLTLLAFLLASCGALVLRRLS
jgi:hypothetical protein